MPLAASKIDIKIFTISGKPVAKLIVPLGRDQQLKAGIPLNVSNFPPGIYIMQILMDTNVLTKKIVRMK